MKKMREGIRRWKVLIKWIKKNTRKNKTTELKLKIVKMHKIKKMIFLSCFKLFKIGTATFVKNCVHRTKVNKTQ